MTTIDRRTSDRRAVHRGGRRLDDDLPGKRCACEAESIRVGQGWRLVWQQCGSCGEVWLERKPPPVSTPAWPR
jgi:hypothetical protein